MKIASTAPAAPRQWPVAPFVEETGLLARVLLAERELDHARLGRVAERRRGAVRVDVADLRRVDARVRRSAIVIARAGFSPLGSGSVMWFASDETP